jgi:hypothetical protein
MDARASSQPAVGRNPVTVKRTSACSAPRSCRSRQRWPRSAPGPPADSMCRLRTSVLDLSEGAVKVESEPGSWSGRATRTVNVAAAGRALPCPESKQEMCEYFRR